MRRSRRVSATALRGSKVKVNTEAVSEGEGCTRPETIRQGSVPLMPLGKCSEDNPDVRTIYVSTH
jgi:hypothetical protein